MVISSTKTNRHQLADFLVTLHGLHFENLCLRLHVLHDGICQYVKTDLLSCSREIQQKTICIIDAVKG